MTTAPSHFIILDYILRKPDNLLFTQGLREMVVLMRLRMMTMIITFDRGHDE